MTALRLTQTTAMVLVLAMAMTFVGPRVAQAGDLGKIAAAVVAGALIYEALDDDDAPRYRQAPRYRYAPPRPIGYGNFTPTPFPNYGRYGCDRDGYYDRYDPYDAYGPPYRYGQYNRPRAYRYDDRRLDVDVHKGRFGTSVDVHYRDR